MTAVTDVTNIIRDTPHVRAEQVNTGYSLTSSLRKVVKLPLTACNMVSGKLARGTVLAASYLTPLFIRKPYDIYCSKQADQILEKTGVAPVQNKLLSWVPESLKTAVSTATPIFSFAASFLPQLQGVSQKAQMTQDVLEGGLKKPVINAIQSVHQIGAQQFLDLVYGSAIRYAIYAYLNSFAAPYVATHTLLDNTLIATQTVLLAYIYAPTAYKGVKAIRSLYKTHAQANELKARFETPQIKATADRIASNFPGMSGEIILKIASGILVETGIAQFLDPATVFNQIGTSLLSASR